MGGRIDRRTLIGLAAGTAVVVVLVVGARVNSTGFPLGALVVAPVVTAVFAGVGPTAVMGVVATLAATAVAPRTSAYFTTGHDARIAAVALGSVLAVWLAHVRTRHERQLSATEEMADLAGALLGTIAQLDTLLDRSPAAFAFFDLDGTIARVNAPFAALFGYEPEELTGQRVGDAMPHIWVRVQPLFERVRATGEPMVDLEVSGTTPREPNYEHHWLASLFPVKRAGITSSEPLIGLGALVVDITERKRAEQEIQLLARASNLFALDLTQAEAVEKVAHLAIPTFADACLVYLATGDPAGRRATVAHRDPDVELELRRLSEALPARRPDGATARAMRTGEIEFLPEVTDEQRRREAIDDRHRDFLTVLDARSGITVPLALGERRMGAVTLLYTAHSNRRFRPDDIAVARELGQRIAQVLDNVRLADEAARATARLRLLARVGELLKVELDLGQRLRGIAQMMLPEFADGAAVYLLEDTSLRLVAAAHPEPAVQEALERATLPVHDVHADLPPCRAVRTGTAVLEAELAPDLADELVTGVRIPAADDQRRLTSFLAVPLVGSDGPIGALGFGYSFSGRQYTDDDIPVALELARRVGPAVENARRFEDTREVIEVLQRTLLPAALPDLPGISVTGRYLPGAAGLRIGGDWYDALVLRDGRLFLAIGDVVGHGVRAASSMGRLRNALEIYAVAQQSPAAMLDNLNRHFSGLPDADMATVGVLVYEPASGVVQFATAGHPPPLVREADGSVHYLDPPRGMPVCASPRAQYEQTEVVLEAGTTLLLYTDGLIERRQESLDVGLDRLAAAVADAPEDVEALADHVISRLVSRDESTDDVALLVVRFETVDEFSMGLGANPRELATLRRAIAEWATRAGASAETCEDVVLAVNEAVANAMEHAYGPGDARVEVAARRSGLGALAVQVRDFGHWRAGRPDDGGGRGLTLIRNLMDDVTVDTTPNGTVVHMTRVLDGVRGGLS
jgi:PAS domain S-box-containing protein